MKNTNTVDTAYFQFPGNMKEVMTCALFANAKIINGIKHLEIPVDILAIDMPYQRKAQGHEKAIGANWDTQEARVLLVSYRDGCFNTIDGKHRVLGARIAGVSTLTCQVLEGLTYEQEAHMCGNQGARVKKFGVKDQINSNFEAKEEREVALLQLCKKYNIVVLPKHRSENPVLTGLSTSLSIYDVYGIECLEFIFSTIKAAGWHMVKGAYSDLMIRTLKNIYANHQDNLEFAKAKLATTLEHADLDIVRARALCAYVGRGNAGAVTALLERCISAGEPVALAS